MIEEDAGEDEEGRDAEDNEAQLPAVNETYDEAGYEGGDVLEEVTEFVRDSLLELAHVAKGAATDSDKLQVYNTIGRNLRPYFAPIKMLV